MNDGPHPDDLLKAIDAANVGFAVADRDGHLTTCSPAFRIQTGLAPDAPLPPQPWYELDNAPASVHDDREMFWLRYRDSGQRWQGMVRWHLANGRRRYFDVTSTPLPDGQIIIVTTDRTERVQMVRTLRNTEQQQRLLLDDLPLAVVLHDKKGRVSYLNRYLANRLQEEADNLAGQSLNSILGYPKGNWNAAASSGTPSGKGVMWDIPAGPLAGTSWLVFTRALDGKNAPDAEFLSVVVDRTDSVKLRQERTQFAAAIHNSQKITAINDFAGSLAHELSNLLHPVGAYARMLTNTPDHPDRKDFAARINKGVMAAGRILRRTLSMAYTNTDEASVTDIGKTMDEVIASARDLAPENLTYDYTPLPEKIGGHCQPGEFRQVILNLLNNAAEAMHFNGRIEVHLRHGLERPDQTDTIPMGRPPYLCVSIRDQGPGIPEDIRLRIFDPFFTTKPVGRGTGLGLAVVQGMVMGWGGSVSVDSSHGRGSTFHVWIPERDMGQ